MSFDTDFDASFDAQPQNETTALLIRARGFIERGWCQGRTAFNAQGASVSSRSEEAVRWCAVGALMAAVPAGRPMTIRHPAYARLREVVGMDVAVFNDAQETVEPVLAAFDRAIAGEPSASQAGKASSAGGTHGGHEAIQEPNGDNEEADGDRAD